jgi:DNA-binding MarR family transcriptional regulator
LTEGTAFWPGVALWSNLPFDGMIANLIVQVTINDPTASTPSREAALREISDGVAALASRRRCAIARRVHHSGISLGHLQILWILQEHGSLPVSRLADWLGIGVPNATGLLDRMEQRDLVERVRDAQDRRVVLARMTDQGRAAGTEHDGWRAELVEQLLEPLATDQVLAVAAGVRRARREAADVLPPAPPAGPPLGDVATHAPADLASPGTIVPERGVRAR